MKHACHITLLLMFAFPVVNSAQSWRSASIDSLLTHYTVNTPGAALGIVKKGELVYTAAAGLADLEHNIPITSKSVFYLASVSKQFTAFCILLLEEQGKLNLTDPVQKYLPDFPQYNRTITIGNLVHHTSGLRDFSTLVDLQGRNYLEDISEREVYTLIKKQARLNFSPGDAYTYSNSGYFLLGKIVQVVSGQSLKQFAHDHIFSPLGMTSTTYLDDNRMLISNRAFSYERDESTGVFNNVIRRYALVGSGGVYSTIEDLARWDDNFYHNKLGKGGQNIINRMLQEDTLTNGKLSGYAFGLENRTYKNHKRISHNGSNAGFRIYFLRLPQDSLTIILLANRRDVDFNIAFSAADIVLGNAIDQKTSPAVPVTNKPVEQEVIVENKQLQQLTGSYFSKELNTYYTITRAGNTLQLSVNDGYETPLQIKSGTVLTSATFGNFTFVERRGKVKGFNLSIARVKEIYFSKVN